MSRRAFVLWYAGLGVVFVLPLWLVVHPPAMDLPGHLALAQVVASRGTDGDPYAGLFSLPSWPSPNTLYYYVVGTLGRVVPIELVSELLLSLAILTTPLAIAYARRANHAEPGLALVGFALALTFNLVAGFIGFVLALPMMLWLMGLARRQVEAPSIRQAVLIAAVATLAYLTHAQVFLFAIGLVGLVALCGAWVTSAPVRRMAIAFAPVLIPIVVALPWYVERTRILDAHGGMDMRFVSPTIMLEYLPIHTFDQLRGDVDIVVGGLVVLGMLALAILALVPGLRPETPETDRPVAHWFRRNAYYLGALCAAISYFVMPAHIRFQQVINGRQAVVALLLCAAAIPMVRGRVGRWVLAATLVACAAYGAVYAEATIRLGDEMGDLRSLIAHAEPGSKLVAPGMPDSQVFRMHVYRHVGSYHVVWNRGYTADTFARFPVQPIRTTGKWRMPSFSPSRPGGYDYVLSGKEYDRPGLRLVDRSGPFYLYRVATPPP